MQAKGMKRTGFKPRDQPMARGTSTLKTTKPMNRGTAQLARSGPMKATAKPIRKRSRTNADPRPKTGEAALCRGQPCYLRLPGLFCSSPASVVPCHSNQIAHGKGKGIKAHDYYTVPGCAACHRELDQGMRFTREEKFAFWDAAFARWLAVRDGAEKGTAGAPLAMLG